MSKRNPASGTRDNAYYLDRLEREAPAIFEDLKAGRIATPAKAFRLAGLRRPRTRLQELKNSWDKASDAEKRAFLHWLKAKMPSPALKPVSVSIAVSTSASTSTKVTLSEDMKREIRRIMTSRAIGSGQIMKEIGFDVLDPSLGLALRRGTRIRHELAAALEKWVRAA